MCTVNGNLDVYGINAADDAMKSLRAQAGRQTWGDRMGDMVGAAAANTVGSVADVLSTARKILGDEDVSYDLADTAADIQVKGVTPSAVAAFAETLLPDSGGIGVYPTFTHVDVREKRSRWKETN